MEDSKTMMGLCKFLVNLSSMSTISCLQQSLVAGFEGDYALYAEFECSLVGSRNVLLLGGWARRSVYSWHPNSVQVGKGRFSKTWRKCEFYSSSVT